MPLLTLLKDMIQYQRDRRAVDRLHLQLFGRRINWLHPTGYNEKIQIFKISKEAEELWPYVDKVEARKYIAKTVGEQYVNELLHVWNNVNEIKLDELPNSFVLKTTHGSGWNVIVKDKKKLDWKKTKRDLNTWMNTSYYLMHGRERQYKKIVPRMLCERYLELQGVPLTEYKIYCFGGVPHYINVIQDKLTKNPKKGYHDANWNPIPLKNTGKYIPLKIHQPKNAETILSLAKKLSAPFRHVRVDFMDLNGKLYVGELTFSSSNGTKVFDPPEYEFAFGALFHLKKRTLLDNLGL